MSPLWTECLMKPSTCVDEELVGPYFAAHPMRGQVRWFIGLSALAQLVFLAVAMCWPSSPELDFIEIPDRIHPLVILPPVMKTGHVYQSFVPPASHHQQQAPEFFGCMTRAAFQRQMQQKQTELSACFLSPHPWRDKGSLSLTINSNGQVVSFAVLNADGKTHNGDVHSCVATHINRWSFDPPLVCEQLLVRYPFSPHF